MWGILIPLMIGIAVGYFSPGKEDKSRLFWIGAIWALVVAVVLNGLGWFLDINPITGADEVDGVGIFLGFLVSIVVFLVGIWIGDMFEGRRTRALPPSSPRV